MDARPKDPNKPVEMFERVAGTAERVGIPVSTFAAGTVCLLIAAMAPVDATKVDVFPWLGAMLVLAALGYSVWITSRSTAVVRAEMSAEMFAVVQWMMQEMSVGRRVPDAIAGPPARGDKLVALADHGTGRTTDDEQSRAVP